MLAWVIQILFMQVELLCVLVSGAEKYDIWTHIYSNAQRKVIKPATMQWIFIEMNMTRLTWHEENYLKFCRHFCLSNHLWLSSWYPRLFHNINSWCQILRYLCQAPRSSQYEYIFDYIDCPANLVLGWKILFLKSG